MGENEQPFFYAIISAEPKQPFQGEREKCFVRLQTWSLSTNQTLFIF